MQTKLNISAVAGPKLTKYLTTRGHMDTFLNIFPCSNLKIFTRYLNTWSKLLEKYALWDIIHSHSCSVDPVCRYPSHLRLTGAAELVMNKIES